MAAWGRAEPGTLSRWCTTAEPIVRRNALEIAVEELCITTAGLGNKAGTIGAAALARHSLLETRGKDE